MTDDDRTTIATARKSWEERKLTPALKRGADPERVVKAAERFSRFHRTLRTEPRYIPHPSTWLNGEQYNDPPEETELPKAAGEYQGFRQTDNFRKGSL